MPSIRPDEPLPRPWARHLSPGWAASWTAHGYHCEAAKCREPVVIVTWRRYRWHGETRVSERFVCAGHGEGFARRYGIEIQPAAEGSEP
jgi:hypothetical protein